MSGSSSFFTSKQAPAFFKHELLKKYMPRFVGRTGSTAEGKVVAILDGFAGPGRYETGEEGSPIIVAEIARAMCGHATVQCHFAEANPQHAAALRSTLTQDYPDVNWTVWDGRLADVLPAILSALGRMPLFAFLDPFGITGVEFETVVRPLLARDNAGHPATRAKTEVLLHLSLEGLRRMAGRLDDNSLTEAEVKAAAATCRALDLTLGSDSWRELRRNRSDWEDAVIDEYLHRIAANGLAIKIPVAATYRGDPRYYLMFATKHRAGFVSMTEAMSSAMEVLFLRTNEVEGSLFSARDMLAAVDAELEREIARNIARLLATGRIANPERQVGDILGTTFGYSRTKHVAHAIKKLHSEGRTATTGVTWNWSVPIEPPG